MPGRHWRTGRIGYANVVGYDPLNEPNLGLQTINLEADNWPIYRKGKRMPFVLQSRSLRHFGILSSFEMSNLNGATDSFALVDLMTDENTIFAPHHYFESISYLLTIEQGLDLLKVCPALYKTGTFIGEFGFFGNWWTMGKNISDLAKKKMPLIIAPPGGNGHRFPGDPHGISWDGMH